MSQLPSALTESHLDKEQRPPPHIKSFQEAFDRPWDRCAIILGIRLRRFVMLTVQHLFRPEGIVSDAKGQVPLQTSAEFVRTYNAQAHEIVDAITAAVTRAQAGLNWLRAEPPDLEEVRQVLNSIVSDGKRAAEIVIRLHKRERAASAVGTFSMSGFFRLWPMLSKKSFCIVERKFSEP
jgi:hypothetical protein